MNKEEFLEMQQEFAQVIYSYERFLKDCILLDYYYNAAFYPQLSKIHYLETENHMLAKALQIVTTQSDEDYATAIKEIKDKYNNDLPKLNNKNRYANLLVRNVSAVPKEAKAEFEEIWKKFILEHHPIVQVLLSEEDKALYNKILPYYYEDNYEGFKKLIAEVGDQFHEVKYPEDEELYTKISQYYYDMRKNVGQDFNKKQNIYPFNKRDTLIDEMAIAREKGELQTKITELLRANKHLHGDFEATFNFDINLTDEKKEEAATPAA